MSAAGFAQTPEPPYYAVIFTSQRTEGDWGYGHMAARMVELAQTMPGFLGVESVRARMGSASPYLTGARRRISGIGKRIRNISWCRRQGRKLGMRIMPCAWPRWSGLTGSKGAKSIEMAQNFALTRKASVLRSKQ